MLIALLLLLALFLQHLVNSLQFLEFLLVEIDSFALTFETVFVHHCFVLALRRLGMQISARIQSHFLEEGGRPNI